MKIVILDGHTANPGDLSWVPLEKFGELVVYERTAPGEVAERIRDAEIVFTNKTHIRANVLKEAAQLRYIGVLATGFDNVDVKEAREMNIPVTNVPGYSTISVAQTVFALLLELCQHTGLHSESARGGDWASCADFSYTKTPMIELAGKTLGIVGYGRIGAQVALIAQAFGMNVIGHRRTKTDEVPFPGFRFTSLDELLETSDVISLHCPLTSQTDQMINRESLARMKPGTLLINTARGRLIADQDLADALNNGVIAGAGLDVLTVEPPRDGNPLLSAKNCVITPHIAWATRESRLRMVSQAVANLEAFLGGTPINVIN